jgi:amino acid transporter
VGRDESRQMASTALDVEGGARRSASLKETKEVPTGTGSPEDVSVHSVAGDHTHRTLKSRHIQLIGIGGTIGTALYVQIGRGLMNGGPGSLFIAFTLW